MFGTDFILLQKSPGAKVSLRLMNGPRFY